MKEKIGAPRLVTVAYPEERKERSRAPPRVAGQCGEEEDGEEKRDY